MCWVIQVLQAWNYGSNYKVVFRCNFTKKSELKCFNLYYFVYIYIFFNSQVIVTPLLFVQYFVIIFALPLAEAAGGSKRMQEESSLLCGFMEQHISAWSVSNPIALRDSAPSRLTQYNSLYILICHYISASHLI